MGQNSIRGNEQVEISINHIKFVQSRVVKDGEKYVLKTVFPCDQKAYKLWKETLLKYKSVSHQYLMLQLKDKFKSSGVCATRGTLEMEFENYPYLLTEEIYIRKGSKIPFTQPQLWYLLYAYISVKIYLFENLQAPHNLIGDIRPDNVFICKNGQVKFPCLLSWPGQKLNYKKTFDGITTYLSPEDYQLLNQGIMSNQVNTRSQLFSIGFTLISAATLRENNDIYNVDKLKFDSHQAKKRINTFKCLNIYSQLLRGVIASLCEFQPKNRLDINDLWLWITKYERRIMTKQSFMIEQIPPKINQHINKLRADILTLQPSSSALNLTNIRSLKNSQLKLQNSQIQPETSDIKYLKEGDKSQDSQLVENEKKRSRIIIHPDEDYRKIFYSPTRGAYFASRVTQGSKIAQQQNPQIDNQNDGAQKQEEISRPIALKDAVSPQYQATKQEKSPQVNQVQPQRRQFNGYRPVLNAGSPQYEGQKVMRSPEGFYSPKIGANKFRVFIQYKSPQKPIEKPFAETIYLNKQGQKIKSIKVDSMEDINTQKVNKRKNSESGSQKSGKSNGSNRQNRFVQEMIYKKDSPIHQIINMQNVNQGITEAVSEEVLMPRVQKHHAKVEQQQENVVLNAGNKQDKEIVNLETSLQEDVAVQNKQVSQNQQIIEKQNEQLQIIQQSIDQQAERLQSLKQQPQQLQRKQKQQQQNKVGQQNKNKVEQQLRLKIEQEINKLTFDDGHHVVIPQKQQQDRKEQSIQGRKQQEVYKKIVGEIYPVNLCSSNNNDEINGASNIQQHNQKQQNIQQIQQQQQQHVVISQQQQQQQSSVCEQIIQNQISSQKQPQQLNSINNNNQQQQDNNNNNSKQENNLIVNNSNDGNILIMDQPLVQQQKEKKQQQQQSGNNNNNRHYQNGLVLQDRPLIPLGPQTHNHQQLPQTITTNSEFKQQHQQIKKVYFPFQQIQLQSQQQINNHLQIQQTQQQQQKNLKISYNVIQVEQSQQALPIEKDSQIQGSGRTHSLIQGKSDINNNAINNLNVNNKEESNNYEQQLLNYDVKTLQNNYNSENITIEDKKIQQVEDKKVQQVVDQNVVIQAIPLIQQPNLLNSNNNQQQQKQQKNQQILIEANNNNLKVTTNNNTPQQQSHNKQLQSEFGNISQIMDINKLFNNTLNGKQQNILSLTNDPKNDQLLKQLISQQDGQTEENKVQMSNQDKDKLNNFMKKWQHYDHNHNDQHLIIQQFKQALIENNEQQKQQQQTINNKNEQQQQKPQQKQQQIVNLEQHNIQTKQQEQHKGQQQQNKITMTEQDKQKLNKIVQKLNKNNTFQQLQQKILNNYNDQSHVDIKYSQMKTQLTIDKMEEKIIDYGEKKQVEEKPQIVQNRVDINSIKRSNNRDIIDQVIQINNTLKKINSQQQLLIQQSQQLHDVQQQQKQLQQQNLNITDVLNYNTDPFVIENSNIQNNIQNKQTNGSHVNASVGDKSQRDQLLNQGNVDKDNDHDISAHDLHILTNHKTYSQPHEIFQRGTLSEDLSPRSNKQYPNKQLQKKDTITEEFIQNQQPTDILLTQQLDNKSDVLKDDGFIESSQNHVESQTVQPFTLKQNDITEEINEINKIIAEVQPITEEIVKPQYQQQQPQVIKVIDAPLLIIQTPTITTNVAPKVQPVISSPRRRFARQTDFLDEVMHVNKIINKQEDKDYYINNKYLSQRPSPKKQ